MFKELNGNISTGPQNDHRRVAGIQEPLVEAWLHTVSKPIAFSGTQFDSMP